MPETAREMEQWLIQRIHSARVSPLKVIHPDTELEALCLDSMAAVILIDELENDLGLVIEPSELWEHTTVSALAQGLLVRQRAAANDERVLSKDLL